MKLEKELTYDRESIPLDDFKNIDNVVKQSEDNLKHLLELEEKSSKKHSLLGGIFHVSVADGQVFYQVVNVKSKTAVVKLCEGICLDNYVDGILGYECELPQDKVVRLVKSYKVLQKLFN